MSTYVSTVFYPWFYLLCKQSFPFFIFVHIFQKGSGLFALLPPPKQATIKEANRSLVPNILTRKPPTVTPTKKPIPKHFLKSTVDKKKRDSDPESDGEDDSIDFFSLNKEEKLPDIPVTDISLGYQDSATYGTPSTSTNGISSNNPQYDLYSHNVEEISVPQGDLVQDFIPMSSNADLELDDEAVSSIYLQFTYFMRYFASHL